MVNSVRKPKATTPASAMQLLSLVEMVAYHHENRKIHRVKEVRLEYPWRSIPFDMRKSAVMTCLAEICAKCMVTADPHPELFQYLRDSLIQYDHPDHFDRDFLIRVMVELSHYLGFGFDVSPMDEQSRYFDLLEGQAVASMPLHPYVMEWSDLVCLKKICSAGAGERASVPIDIRQRLVDLLLLYYQLHVESLKELNSLRVYRELM